MLFQAPFFSLSLAYIFRTTFYHYLLPYLQMSNRHQPYLTRQQKAEASSRQQCGQFCNLHQPMRRRLLLHHRHPYPRVNRSRPFPLPAMQPLARQQPSALRPLWSSRSRLLHHLLQPKPSNLPTPPLSASKLDRSPYLVPRTPLLKAPLVCMEDEEPLLPPRRH